MKSFGWYMDSFKLALVEEFERSAHMAMSEFERDSLYAFCVCSDSSHFLSAALNTREHLHKSIEGLYDLGKLDSLGDPGDLALRCEMNCDEWLVVGYKYDLFDGSTQLLEDLRRDFEEDESLQDKERKMVTDSSVSAILNLREKQPEWFGSSAVLSGLQFSDAYGAQIYEIIEVSSAVNSAAWHEKMLRQFEM